ncbi:MULTISPECIES: hypothetical protein [unclassified Streptomyces]|uniref:hypothetical protein n=1 Tax=unclassified Streptomyces TaxID=2593676 RepID=UPI00116338A1|nr:MULTISPECIES: hypothetical protein [unclassified Streptomyces]NMI57110.1 hypothetical protein [Streptomyces sp. RLA2-12]QDN56490.1 hypothetical protein FNV67_15350 [Streptomyces sp. S1D4-20]QDN66667.1 hypothetical protein FNV66_14945 [Streptomyces sp. S1D4-14]QDO49074.1 hypothetical protein FNV60_13195 [Streptomyces sp. RLB3-5]QDO59315.1 hypothetical protein FNV59_15440 [Streptomyces sp. RLB1-8]
MNPNPTQQYKQGEKVRYQNEQQQQCDGTVQHVEGAGQSSRYTIKNQATNQTDEVPHTHVQGRLQ